MLGNAEVQTFFESYIIIENIKRRPETTKLIRKIVIQFVYMWNVNNCMVIIKGSREYEENCTIYKTIVQAKVIFINLPAIDLIATSDFNIPLMQYWQGNTGNRQYAWKNKDRQM